jgi:hypothetical protein
MISAKSTETNRVHNKATCVYRTYYNVEQAFKKLIIDDFEDQFLKALSDEILGYANCTSLQCVSHLLTYYALIAPTELRKNCERLNAPYDHKQPIETLIQKIQDARAFAVAGGQSYCNAMVVNLAFTLVFNTRLFPDYCRTWQARAVAEKTWVKFELDFTAARREFRVSNQTVQQSVFHSANMMIEQGRGETMQDTVDVTAQLATAMASDRGTVATLTATNVKLADQIETLQAYIKMLKE